MSEAIKINKAAVLAAIQTARRLMTRADLNRKFGIGSDEHDRPRYVRLGQCLAELKNAGQIETVDDLNGLGRTYYRVVGKAQPVVG